MSAVKFPLGRVVSTPGALELLPQGKALAFLSRHVCGDWGDLCKEDQTANEVALRDGSRILSAYHDENRTKFWIITEADRSVTTFLLPEEY